MAQKLNEALDGSDNGDLGSITESVHDVSLALHGRSICIREVNYYFGSGETRTQVLFENKLDIGRGEVVIMTGPSGSGKTTLLTLIGGLRTAVSGSIVINNRELVGASRRALVAHRRQIGFIFQHHNLFSSLSAVENVRMATALRPGGRAQLQKQSREILDRLGLSDRMGHHPSRLSGGQQQRVAIARALVNRPLLVLADEPTAALDASSGATVMQLLRELADGPEQSTVLIVTHDQRLLDRADRIVNMVGGRIVSSVMPAMTIRILKTMSKLKELQGLTETTLTRIADQMMVEHRRKGEIVAREGTPGHKVCIIGEGTAEVIKDDVVQRELGPGDSYGGFTVITGKLIKETVRAKTDLEVYILSKEGYMKVVETDKTYEQRIRELYMTRQ
jgi:putative ABC transport system ATP-binding protein